jgi:hypothetical protein
LRRGTAHSLSFSKILIISEVFESGEQRYEPDVVVIKLIKDMDGG